MTILGCSKFSQAALVSHNSISFQLPDKEVLSLQFQWAVFCSASAVGFVFFIFCSPGIFHREKGEMCCLGKYKIIHVPPLFQIFNAVAPLWSVLVRPYKKQTGPTSRWNRALSSVVGKLCTSTMGSKVGSWLWKINYNTLLDGKHRFR